MDSVATTLLRRVRELIAARPEMDRQAFGRAIGRPTPSWLSEFFAGKRTTNDLRLVIRIGRVFGVTMGYLLDDAERSRDAGAVTLLAAWESMTDERDRQALLNLALMLKGRGDDPGTASPLAPLPARGAANGTTAGSRKRR